MQQVHQGLPAGRTGHLVTLCLYASDTVLSAGPTSEPPPPAAVPDVPATKEALLKALQKVQRKDERDIFRHPVTEAQVGCSLFEMSTQAHTHTSLLWSDAGCRAWKRGCAISGRCSLAALTST